MLFWHSQSTVFVHAPPVPMAWLRHVSHGSPALAMEPSKQYSVAHALAQGPGLLHAQFCTYVTRLLMPVV